VLIKTPSKNIFQKDYGWHTGRFHFSFGDYQDNSNQNFGVLSAFNDFVVQPKNGFDTHPHSEMEIISYCVSGSLKHIDSTGNFNELRRGESQYTCTGSGITHSEMNEDSSTPLRFLQIWIKPMRAGLTPVYRENKRPSTARIGQLRCIASGEKKDGVMQIAQDAQILAGEIEANQMVRYESEEDRQSYFVCLEGELSVNGFNLAENDSMKLWGKDAINLIPRERSHLIVVEMARE
jgi:redox-sensitive bicupin YhaK (pirin superfamily)